MCPPPKTCGGRLQRLFADWIPAFAGMTDGDAGMPLLRHAGLDPASSELNVPKGHI